MNLLIDEVLSSHSSISFKAAALILFSLWLFIRLFNPHITQRLFLLFYTWDITALLTVPPFKRDNTHTCALPTNRPWFADDVKILACDWPSFPSSTIVVCNPTFNIFKEYFCCCVDVWSRYVTRCFDSTIDISSLIPNDNTQTQHEFCVEVNR